MRFYHSDGSTLGHQRNPSRPRTTRRAAIKQTTPRRLTRWLKLHEVGFTSALSQNLFVLEVDATSISKRERYLRSVCHTSCSCGLGVCCAGGGVRRAPKRIVDGCLSASALTNNPAACKSGLTPYECFLRIREFWLARVGRSDPSR